MRTSQESLLHNVHKLVFLIDKAADRILSEKLNLSFTQFLVLMALRRHNGVSQEVVAQYLKLTPAAVSRQVEGLAKRKLLTQKENAENRRAHILSLSKSGLKTFDAAMKELSTEFAPSFAAVPKDELEKANSTIEKLLAGITGACDEKN